MNSQICVDASFIIKLGLPEEGSNAADTLWRDWRKKRTEIVAPSLLLYEVTSVLRNVVYRGRISQDEGLEILRYLLELDITFLTPKGLHLDAWQIATDLAEPAAYDAHYLALAQTLGCELWTGDRKLSQKAGQKMCWIKSLYKTK